MIRIALVAMKVLGGFVRTNHFMAVNYLLYSRQSNS